MQTMKSLTEDFFLLRTNAIRRKRFKTEQVRKSLFKEVVRILAIFNEFFLSKSKYLKSEKGFATHVMIAEL